MKLQSPPDYQPRICRNGRPSSRMWDRLAGQDEHATFYQTRTWHEVCSMHATPKPGGAERARSDPLWLRFNDGTDVVVPRVRLPRKLHVFSRYAASPEGCYGGILSSAPLTSAHISSVWRVLMKDSFEWRTNPLQPLRPPGLLEVRHDSTVMLDLRPGFAEILSAWQRDGALIPRNARRAVRMGVSVRHATSREDFAQYQSILAASAKRWTDPAICPLEKMWALFLEAPDDVQLWVAEKDGRMLCGQLFFVHKRHVSIYNKGALEEAFECRAPTFLDHVMIERFASEGRWWYDMGESGGSASAHAYKLRVCRHEADASIFVYRSPVYDVARSAVTFLRRIPEKAAAICTW